MNLKSLIQTQDWSKISSKFLEIFPKEEKNIKGYKSVYEQLLLMSPEISDITIVIYNEMDEGVEFIEACGLHNNPKNKEESYLQGIELTPWRKWLGMEISDESLEKFSEIEIIVYCLYEMTFWGFSEENIAHEIKEIEKNSVNRESMTEKERDNFDDVH